MATAKKKAAPKAKGGKWVPQWMKKKDDAKKKATKKKTKK